MPYVYVDETKQRFTHIETPEVGLIIEAIFKPRFGFRFLLGAVVKKNDLANFVRIFTNIYTVSLLFS